MKTIKQRKLEHINNLISIFGLTHIKTEYDKLLLYRKLKTLDTKAHKLSEDYCNGVIETEDSLKHGEIVRGIDFYLDKIKDRLKTILRLDKNKVPVFINTDPRGYSLKIKESYVREHNLTIHRDWGGYGIIAPEIKKRW